MSRHFVHVVLCGLVLVAATVPAQDLPAQSVAAAPAPGNPQRQIQHLGRLLELTPQQVATLAPVIAQRQQQLATLRSDTSLDNRVRRARLRAIQRDTDVQIQSVLSDSQRQKYLQWKQQLEERRRQKRQAAAGRDNGA